MLNVRCAALNLDRVSFSNRNKGAAAAKDYSSSGAKAPAAVYQQSEPAMAQQSPVYKVEQSPLQAPVSQGATQSQYK
ncbi:MAG: hypothetical protein EOO40_02050 [Deltaproteobacteria bacterium]|nr:MAG: hypothetical protein EOO40_02050 [Deltaproteobacteria bacterium]